MGILVEVIVSAFFSVLMSTGEEVKTETSEKATTELICEIREAENC